MTKIKFTIAPEIDLPEEAVTETFGVLAAKGHGKTYCAQKLAEQMITAGAQIVAIDPVGNWWCLRVAADGKSRWSDIPIFGGNHADFPLPPEKGAFVADLVVEHNLSAVLDVSTMMEGEKRRFVGDFATRLKALKARQPEPSVLHLFLEEAQDFIPERQEHGAEKMKGALTRLVRQGRNWGVGVTMVSQRPQSISKEALNMTSCLLVGAMMGTHERKAIKAWIDEQGRTQEAEAHLEKLPTLSKGEMVLWSPAWLGHLGIIHVSKKETFDASATPRLGAKRKNVGEPQPIDAEAIRRAMANVEEEAKASDPKELRRKLAEVTRKAETLEKQIAEKLRDEFETEAKKPLVNLALARLPLTKVKQDLENLSRRVTDSIAFVEGWLESAHRDLKPEKSNGATHTKTMSTPGVGRSPPVHSPPAHDEHRRAKAKSSNTEGAKLVGKSRKILQHLQARAPKGYTREQLAILVGMNASGGGFANYLGSLKASGFIAREDDAFVSTAAGERALAGDFITAPATTDGLVEMWLAAPKITGKAKAILRLLVKSYPQTMSRDVLAAAVDMEPKGGGFANYLGTLSSANLIERTSDGIRASDHLFPD